MPSVDEAVDSEHDEYPDSEAAYGSKLLRILARVSACPLPLNLRFCRGYLEFGTPGVEVREQAAFSDVGAPVVRTSVVGIPLLESCGCRRKCIKLSRISRSI